MASTWHCSGLFFYKRQYENILIWELKFKKFRQLKKITGFKIKTTLKLKKMSSGLLSIKNTHVYGWYFLFWCMFEMLVILTKGQHKFSAKYYDKANFNHSSKYLFHIVMIMVY